MHLLEFCPMNRGFVARPAVAPYHIRLGILLFCFISVAAYAQEAPYNSSTISGLGARNIGSATMGGRISALAGIREPSGKITLFVGAASGGVWKSDDSGTR